MATIAVDFDGTMVEHAFPEVGRKIGAGPALRLLIKAGHKIILYTMRSDDSPEADFQEDIDKNSRKYLSEAVDWCKQEGVRLYGINWHPTQHLWTASNKCHAQFCIDDRNVGTPLYKGFVDWVNMLYLMEQSGLLNGVSDMEFNSTIQEIKQEREEI